MEFTKLKIDKNVPAPVGWKRYDFKTFEVGDSTFVSFGGEVRNTPAYISALRYGKLNGKQFTGRSVVEDGVKGVRVWRVK